VAIVLSPDWCSASLDHSVKYLPEGTTAAKAGQQQSCMTAADLAMVSSNTRKVPPFAALLTSG
jgi:hypothetical protein